MVAAKHGPDVGNLTHVHASWLQVDRSFGCKLAQQHGRRQVDVQVYCLPFERPGYLHGEVAGAGSAIHNGVRARGRSASVERSGVLP